MLDDKLMNFGHVGTVPISRARRNVGVCLRRLLEEVFDSLAIRLCT
jgi:hypothetical protein